MCFSRFSMVFPMPEIATFVFWSNSAVLHGTTCMQCSAVRDGTAGMGDNVSLFSTDDPTDSPSDFSSGLWTPRCGSCTPPASPLQSFTSTFGAQGDPPMSAAAAPALEVCCESYSYAGSVPLHCDTAVEGAPGQSEMAANAAVVIQNSNISLTHFAVPLALRSATPQC